MQHRTLLAVAALALAAGGATNAVGATWRTTVTPGPVWVEPNGRSVGAFIRVTSTRRKCWKVPVRLVVTPGFTRFKPKPVIARRVMRIRVCNGRPAARVDLFDIKRPDITPGRVWVTIRAPHVRTQRVAASISSF